VQSVQLSSPAGVATVNRWVNQSTRGKIPRLLGAPLDSSIGMLVTNAVYFKGRWLDPFTKASTRARGFTLSSGRRVEVPMMARTGTLGYRRAPGYQMVRLPYRAGRAAMYIVLPDSGLTVEELAGRLDGEGWPPSLTHSSAQRVHLVLPKFRAELSADLTQDTRALGRGLAFDSTADFTGIASRRTAERMWIGGIIQKVFVEIDEEGTEAAAVTGVLIPVRKGEITPIPFVVDRPFLFVIRDEVSGADLFVGRIANPAK
jgi:serpin B